MIRGGTLRGFFRQPDVARHTGRVSNRAEEVEATHSGWDAFLTFEADAAVPKKKETTWIGLDFCVEISYLSTIIFRIFRRNAPLRPRCTMPTFKCQEEAHQSACST